MTSTDPLEQLDNPENLDKYKMAGSIATKTVDIIVHNSKKGIMLIKLLDIGNKFAKSELARVYDKVNKGFSFPLCLSLNNVAGHYIPQNNEVLKEGDILKIELGIHIDGFPANIVFSTLISEDSISDRRADIMNACIKASKEIIKIMTPEHTNIDIMNIMQSYAQKYNCNLPSFDEFVPNGNVPGIMSCQMSRYVIDGKNEDNDEFPHQFILSKNNPNYEFTMRKVEFLEDEVYAIDILMSTGLGKLRETDNSKIYKRNHDNKVMLKLKASRDVLNSFNQEKFPICTDTSKLGFNAGMRDCLSKKLVEKYPIVTEKDGEYIARIKFTVVVGDEPILICGRSGDGELSKLKKIEK